MKSPIYRGRKRKVAACTCYHRGNLLRDLYPVRGQHLGQHVSKYDLSGDKRDHCTICLAILDAALSA